MDEFPQTPEELEAHYGPDGPVVVARRFFEALHRAHSLGAAYEVMTPDLRHDRASAWVAANARHPALVERDPETLIDNLSQPVPDDSLWPPFEDSSLQDFARAYSFIDSDYEGYASRPRPIGVNQELVLLVKCDLERQRTFDRATLVSGVQFVLEYHVDRWLVAAFGRIYSAAELLEQGLT